MTEPIRVGLVGAGTIVKTAHLPNLRARGAEIAFISTCDESEAAAFASANAVAVSGTDLADCIVRTRPNAVIVASANCDHASSAGIAAEYGVHVLCEKPLGISAIEVEQLEVTARRAGIALALNVYMRQLREFQRMKRMIANGALGKVHDVRIRMLRQNGIPGYGGWFTTKALAGAGALFDLGSHCLDLAMWLTGETEWAIDFVRLSGRFGAKAAGLGDWAASPVPRAVFDVDDQAYLSLLSANATRAEIDVAWARYGPDEFRVEIYGSEGGLDYSPGRYGPKSPLRHYSAQGARVVGAEISLRNDDGAADQQSAWLSALQSFLADTRRTGHLLDPILFSSARLLCQASDSWKMSNCKIGASGLK